MILSRGATLELEPDLVPGLTPAEKIHRSENASKAAPGDTETAPPAGAASNAAATLEEVERAHIIAVLNQAGGVVEGQRGAAKILGLHPNTLRHRMRKLGLKRSAYHSS